MHDADIRRCRRAARAGRASREQLSDLNEPARGEYLEGEMA